MAKNEIIYSYLFWIFICSGAFSQNLIKPPKPQRGNSYAQSLKTPPLGDGGLRECVKELYDSQIGVREIGGANRGASVEMYLASVELGPGYAWCAAFVSWCYQNANIQAPLSGWVPSYALKDKRIYHRGKFEKTTPQQGDVFMLWYTNKNRPAHIGFVDQWGEKWIITVEGNTNDAGSREGDGVYRKRRLKKQIWAVSNFIDATRN